MHPEIGTPTVQYGIGFIGMDRSVATGNLFGDVVDHRLRQRGQLLFKADQRRR